MKIFKISQNVNNDYDTYDSAIVCAKDEDEARLIHPSQEINSSWDIYYDFEKKQFWNKGKNGSIYLLEDEYGSWTNDIDKIKVEYIGKAKEGMSKGVILASFNAG